MMSTLMISRRKALQLFGITAGAVVVEPISAATKKVKMPAFTYSLNMATIRGQNLGFAKELEIASKAGYHSVEIWIDSLNTYLAAGGTLKEVRTMLGDLGLQVENCISFNKWIVDDEAIRNAALEHMKIELDQLAEIGCKRIAATAMGLSNDTTISLDTIAERYRTVLDMGVDRNVIPLLEMWGFQRQVSTVSEVVYSAMQSGNAKASILLDIFHLYKGDTPLDTLSFINPQINPILHMNDHPATISRAVITDADRIYPGDGVAPFKRILKTLKRHDQPLILSAELFNAIYYKQDALTVAKTALKKMKAVAEGV